eukprot:CAMPEP_0180516482 /NCGR_PEP_ID=MMETSP1036_2-20121128/53944_1 /TAXON_ID=632150 /ORGANISM="Azadinium spinosum, Strain 3D9" /LENGTH=63 /DNA_ID=CAMNT_0022528289 /DNA_START=99 /DNA_END=286 /DNA_ORIENTATION=+
MPGPNSRREAKPHILAAIEASLPRFLGQGPSEESLDLLGIAAACDAVTDGRENLFEAHRRCEA